MANWLDAMSRFLEDDFSPAEVKQGVILYRENKITNLSKAGDAYIAEFDHGNAGIVTFTLEKWDNETRCVARLEDQVRDHGAHGDAPRVYAAALTLHATLESGRAIPENPEFTTLRAKQENEFDAWVSRILAANAENRLKPRQHDYLKKVLELFRSLEPDSQLNPRDLLEIEKHLKPRRATDFNYWQSVPETLPRFWDYLALAITDSGGEVPAFLEPVTDLKRVRREVADYHHRLQVEEWQNFIQQSQRETHVQRNPRIELRLYRDGREACWQIRHCGQKDFSDLRREEFIQLYEKEKKNQLHLSATAATLWQHLKLHWQQNNALRLHLTTPEGSRCLHHLLLQAETRRQVVGAGGEPLVWSEIPLGWRCRKLADTSNYALELVNERGFPAPEDVLCLPGAKTLYLWGDTIYSGPRGLDLSRRNPLRVTLPAEVVESTQGLSFLQSLGVEAPENLLDQVEERHYRIEVQIALDNCPSRLRAGSECLLFTVKAREPRGGRVERLGPDIWEILEPGSTPPAGKLLLLNAKHKEEIAGQLRRLGARPDPEAHTWSLVLTQETPQHLLHWIEELPEHVSVDLQGELSALREPPLQVDVQLRVQPRDLDWLDLKMVVKHESLRELPDAEIARLLKAPGRFVRIPEKGWQRAELKLSEEQKAELLAAGFDPAKPRNTTRRVHALSFHELDPRLFAEKDLKKIVERQKALTPPSPVTLPPGLQTKLRDYQQQGVEFLCYLTQNGFGGILADDMGLGKTLQTLCWLLWLKQRLMAGRQADGKTATPFTALIICPKSVTDGWLEEAARHTPTLTACRHKSGPDLSRAVEGCDLYVANYAQIRRDAARFQSRPWSAVILDEGQFIKNPQSITARVVRGIEAPHRVVLTGTPIENRLMDLWSLMQFAMPGVLGTHTHFKKFYDSMDSPAIRQRIAKRVKPFMLRRTKDQVARDLPAKLETVLSCELEGRQKQLYDAELAQARRAMLKIQSPEEFEQQRFSIFRGLTRLRQICCHPGLINDGGADWPSAKLRLLEEHLDQLVQEGHRVLVFSQWVTMLDIIRQRLQQHDYPFLYLTGSTENRAEMVQKFRDADGSMIFLLSLRAAGAGLNLSEARYVFLFDPWWNPAVEAQAVDRAHRIGTRHNVLTYRLCAHNTIEHKMLKLKERKHELARDVINTGNIGDFQELSFENIRQLLE